MKMINPLSWRTYAGLAFALALERTGASGDQGLFQDRIELQGIRPKFDLPDLSGNVRFTRLMTRLIWAARRSAPA